MDRKDFIKNTSSILGGSLIFNPRPITKKTRDKEASGIVVVAPSVLGINETFDLGVRILTEPYYTRLNAGWNRPNPGVNGPFNLSPRGTHYMDNVLPKWEGVVNITSSDDYKGPSTFSFATGKGPYEQDVRPIRRLKGLQFTKPGIKYIRVIDPDSGIEGVSNPIHVTSQEPEERLFWGDLHMHSLYTDAIRIPEEIYTFAKDEAFLDICAMSDHSEALTDEQWDYFRAVTNKFNEPGQFVTLVGGEWTSMKHWGHHNYYYRGNEGPILRSDEPEYEKIDQLYDLARERKALIVPHHTAQAQMGNDWSKHDPEVERLVEIYSTWGNSERPDDQGNPLPIQNGGEKKGQHVLDALKHGYRLGFIGGGDIHDGRPGDSLTYLQDKPKSYRLFRRQGLMGVWSKDLTREAIFDALWNRRVYATTNHRTWLKFSINGHPMGSEIVVDDEMLFEVEAVSNRPIAHIDLVRDGRDIEEIKPKPGEKLKISWQKRVSHHSSETWYYVRLRLQDSKDMAWSSPIWVDM